MKAPRMSLVERLVAATKKTSLVGETSERFCFVIPPGSSSAAAQDSQTASAVRSGRIEIVTSGSLPSTSTSGSGAKDLPRHPCSWAGVIGETNDL